MSVSLALDAAPYPYMLIHTPLLGSQVVGVSINDSLPSAQAGSKPAQRPPMLFILLAVFATILGLLTAMSHVQGSADNSHTAASESVDARAINASIAATSGNLLSPAFTAEVQHWAPEILAWAQTYALDPDMIATIMQIESCGDPNAVSSAGAQGLFQVMPFHFAAGEDMQDPDTNARRGLNYLRERLTQTSGDYGRAFAGYNGGHVAAGSSWDYWAAETQRYYIWSKGIYDEVSQGLTESQTLQQWLAAGGASLCRQAASRLGLAPVTSN